MAYVITESCIAAGARTCRDSRGGFPCVEACPADGIYARPGDPQLYIDADECLDCADCFVECPVAAIQMDCDVPAEVRAFNVENYRRAIAQAGAA